MAGGQRICKQLTTETR